MEYLAKIVAEHASFFNQYGNYVLIPVIVLLLLLEWKISKSTISNLKKKIIGSFLSISVIFLAILVFLINFPFKPMVSSLSSVDEAIGSEMVHFEYLNIATNEIEVLENYNDKTVLLNFWGTFCPPCIKEFPDLKRLESEFSEDLVVIAVSKEDPETIKRFISNVASPSIIGSQKDQDWINPESFLPLTIIIDQGEVKNRFFGSRTYEEFDEIIKQVNVEKEIDKLEIAKTYYEVLDKSNVSGIETLLTDSLLTKETEYNYKQTFSRKEYVEWLKWDSVFEPTYKILEIEEKNGTVKAKISKIDKRISFLHNEPIVTEQVIHFENDKITSIETTKYVIFNDSVFVKNRDTFVNWIDKNHPELNGFLYDQTKTGGIKYLKAIELYENKK